MPGLITNIDYKRIFFKEPFLRNLLVNYTGWTVFGAGNGWAFDDVESEDLMLMWESAADHRMAFSLHDIKCWVTSSDWCFKLQTVDLLENGVPAEFLDRFQPKIIVSAWTSAQRNADSVYHLEVSLLEDVDGPSPGHPHGIFRLPNVRGTEEREEVTPRTYKFSKHLEQSCGWHYVTHTFQDYGQGVRYVRFLDGGKDTTSTFWAGFYGSKMAVPCIVVVIPWGLRNKK